MIQVSQKHDYRHKSIRMQRQFLIIRTKSDAYDLSHRMMLLHRLSLPL